MSRLSRFAIVAALGFVVQLTTLELFSHAGAGDLVATGMAVSIALVHNFIWHVRWTWRDRARRTTTAERLAQFVAFVCANGLVSIAGSLGITAELTRGAGMPLAAANFIAILACGLLNFGLAGRVVR